MTDAELKHLCLLASIQAAAIQDPSFDPREYGDLTGGEAHDARNCLRILCRAFVELMNRQEMKPTFRVPAQ